MLAAHPGHIDPWRLGGLVEIVNVPSIHWRKSTRSSQHENSDCVELAAVEEQVAVRDSKDPNGPKLMLTRAQWNALSGRLKNGDQA
jgi:hypothetical protein